MTNFNLDIPLLEQQVSTLSSILGRCDDDDDSTVHISFDEGEHLEGILNLCLGVLGSGITDGVIPRQHLLSAARGLAATDNSNPEYNRALVELVMDSIGLSMDDKEEGYILVGLEPPADVVH